QLAHLRAVARAEEAAIEHDDQRVAVVPAHRLVVGRGRHEGGELQRPAAMVGQLEVGEAVAGQQQAHDGFSCWLSCWARGRHQNWYMVVKRSGASRSKACQSARSRSLPG